MKLAQLQEASHISHHPLISWIYKTFERENASHGLYQNLTQEQFDEAHDILPDHLGDPIDVDGENMSWRIDNEYGAFYVDLQNQGGAAPKYSRYRLTVSKLYIQEARHHIDHPIIEWIKKFVKTSKVGDNRSYRLISEKQAALAAEVITREFGDQITVKEWPVTEWNIDIDTVNEKVVHLQVDHKNLQVDISRLRYNY